VGSGGPFDLRAPARMLLGVGGSASISLRAPPGPPPRLAASLGVVSTPTVGPDGRLHATYTPSGRASGFAIVSAVGEGGAPIDWIVIALHGRPQVEVRSRSDTVVRVRVAGIDYGPVRTDATGVAALAVLVPPGVESAV